MTVDIELVFRGYAFNIERGGAAANSLKGFFIYLAFFLAEKDFVRVNGVTNNRFQNDFIGNMKATV